VSAPHAYTWNGDVVFARLPPLVATVAELLSIGVPVDEMTAAAVALLGNADPAAIEALATVLQDARILREQP